MEIGQLLSTAFHDLPSEEKKAEPRVKDYKNAILVHPYELSSLGITIDLYEELTNATDALAKLVVGGIVYKHTGNGKKKPVAISNFFKGIEA